MVSFQRFHPADILGGNDANNPFSSAQVAQNADGSVLERLELIAGTIATKSAETLPATGNQTIFTVSGGLVLIDLLIGVVTTVVQSQSCNLKVTSVPTSGTAVDLAANLDINADEAGTIYLVEGDASALIGVNAGAAYNALGTAQIVVPAGVIRITTSATNTGATKWYCRWRAIDAGASVS